MFSPDRAHPSNSFFAPQRFLDSHTFLTKSGEVGVHLAIEGIDFECLTDEKLEEYHHNLTTALLAMPEEVRYYSYLVKLDGVEFEDEKIEHPLVERTVKGHRQYLLDFSKLTTIRSYLTLVYEPTGFFGADSITPNFLKISKKKVDQSVALLHAAVRSLGAAVGAILGITMLDQKEIFEWLRFLAALDLPAAKNEPLDYTDGLDHWMSSTMITPHTKGVTVGQNHVEILSMRKAPKYTWPNVVSDLLKTPGNFILCSQFKRQSSEKAVSEIQKKQDHWDFVKYAKNVKALIQIATRRGNTAGMIIDPVSAKKVKECSRAINAVGNGSCLGHYQFTAVLFSKDEAQLEAAVSHALKVVGQRRGSLVRETYWAFGAYMTIFPGRTPKWGRKWQKKRYKLLPAEQFLDLAFIYNYRCGSKKNTLTKRPALIVMERANGTPYFFNLVPPGGNRKGALIFGEPGSGKSVLMQALIDHGRKDKSHVLIMDGLGGSFRTLMRKHNGAYFELLPEAERWQFALNPFQAFPDSSKTRQYLSTLLRACMQVGKFEENAEKNLIIYNEVVRVLQLPFDKRRFSALKFPPHIDPYIQPWREGNQYGFVFDNPKDTFSLERLQTIDFSAIGEFNELVSPLLLHFLGMWDRVVYDPRLLTTEKDLFLDETWKPLQYSVAANYLQAAARSWRKRLGGLVMGSQSIVELKEAGMLDLISELCPLKILLANPGGNAKGYAEPLHLNEKEVQLYSQQTEPGTGLYKSNTESVVFRLRLDPVSYWTYTNHPFDNELRDTYIAKYGFEEGIQKLAEVRMEKLSGKVA